MTAWPLCTQSGSFPNSKQKGPALNPAVPLPVCDQEKGHVGLPR